MAMRILAPQSEWRVLKETLNRTQFFPNENSQPKLPDVYSKRTARNKST